VVETIGVGDDEEDDTSVPAIEADRSFEMREEEAVVADVLLYNSPTTVSKVIRVSIFK